MDSIGGKKDDSFDRTLHRARELKSDGLEWVHAHGIAWLEERIRQWPPGWGDDLQVLIYGDFEQPKAEIDIPILGIVVHPEKIEKSVIYNALTVLKATVKVNEKSVPALIDAARRINVFLGSYTLVGWGNTACGWWSWVTHGTGGGAMTQLDHKDLPKAIEGISSLPMKVRNKVDAALYWVREPKNLMFEHYRSDLLRIYSAYWNALECLVEAINIIKPRRKLSRQEKQDLINNLLKEHGEFVNPQFIENAYQLVVNPGFVAKASHALSVCFGQEASYYIDECFRHPDKQNRLYDIRNSINHGDIDAENPEELLRVETRLSKLWMIIWRMFGRLIPFPAPLDSSLKKD